MKSWWQQLTYSLVALAFFATASVAQPLTIKPIPVIFDTDIGDDIDDTWALALLLKCPELDVKLVVTDMNKGLYRAKLVAKLLEVAERTDIPVAIGYGSQEESGAQAKWVEDYELDSYPGKVYEDGAQAIIDIVNTSEQPMTLIAVGPVPNIAEALRRAPEIAEKLRFVGMHGSVRKGYTESGEIGIEYNVVADAKACQKVFTAPWEMTITPLDTCGAVVLHGDKYARIRDSDDPLIQALIENYELWAAKAGSESGANPARDQSSTLFDTVAVYLAITDQLCKIETLPIRVTDEGKTVIDPSGKQMEVATEWRDLPAFENWLVERLVGPGKE